MGVVRRIEHWQSNWLFDTHKQMLELTGNFDVLLGFSVQYVRVLSHFAYIKSSE